MKSRKKSEEDRELKAAKRHYLENHGIPEKPWLAEIEPSYRAVADRWPRGTDGRLSPIPKRSWNDLKKSDMISLDEFISSIVNDLPIFVKEIDLIHLMRPKEIGFLKKVLEEYKKGQKKIFERLGRY